MFGAVIGALIDRGDGDSGIKGAILGGVAEKAVKVAVPLAITFAIGYAVQKGLARAWDSAVGERGGDPAS